MRSRSCRKTKILFLTKYVCRSRVDFLGPIGERYAGLYYSFMERSRGQYDFYWRTSNGETFEYQPGLNILRSSDFFKKNASRFALARFLLSFCTRDYLMRKIIIVSYPNFQKSLLIAILLFILRPLRVIVIVDVQDLALPRERPWTISYLVWWMVNEIFYCYAHFIFNAVECAKLYACRTRGSVIVIPMAAHEDIITPGRATLQHNGLTLGYIGSIDERRGFPHVFAVVDSLRADGYLIDIVISGDKPENIDLNKYPWVQWYEKQPLNALAELLRSVDVGIIPYVDKEYWGLMSITKTSAYMAAGLPILSLRLAETANILAAWNCGISVDDWDSFRAAIEMLCHDKALRATLGRNARRAAVQEYNWENQVEKFGNFIGKLEQMPERGDRYSHNTKEVLRSVD